MATNDFSTPDMPRVILWSCPRSLSTAFERAVLELGNVEVFNEEFTTAFVFGPERNKNYSLNLAPLHTYQTVKDRLQADYPGKAAVFAKDFGFSLDNRYHMIPSGFYHTFLIRNPTKVFPSLKARYESSRLLSTAKGTTINELILADGYTYKEIRDLYKEIKRLGLPILIIDADDLLEDPVQMFRQYCQLTGLPFKESMVKWKPASIGDLDWHCSRALKFLNYMAGWYESALKSSGFRKPEPRHIDVASLSPDTKLAIEVSRPYYDEMYAQRITLKY